MTTPYTPGQAVLWRHMAPCDAPATVTPLTEWQRGTVTRLGQGRVFVQVGDGEVCVALRQERVMVDAGGGQVVELQSEARSPHLAKDWIVHINAAPCWESPPIRKGSPAQKFWKYQHRMDRIERLSKRYAASKGRGLMMSESLWFSGLVMDTMDLCVELGYWFDEDASTGQPYWHRPDGSMVEWLN